MKNKKIFLVLALLSILLMGCGEKTILPYEEAYKKLDDAGYEIIASKDEDEILEKIREMSDSYDSSIEREGLIFPDDVVYEPESLAANISGFILAKKDDSFAFLFYCNNKDTSYIISRIFDQIYATDQRVMGSSSSTYYYLCSVDVNDILNLSKDEI